jgi:lipopolysaccharide/colanic/teichoic acid biosynthesis glycosyltransferase
MRLLIVQTLLLLFFIETVVYLKLSEVNFSFNFLITITLSWLLTVWLTHPHNPKRYQKRLKYIIAPYIRMVFIFVAIGVTMGLFFLELPIFELIYVFSISSLSFLSFMLLFLTITANDGAEKKSFNNISRYQQEDLKFPPSDLPSKQSISALKNFPVQLQQLLDEVYHRYSSYFKINNSTVQDETMVLSDSRSIIRNELSLLIVEKRLNDFSTLNKQLLNFHSSLKNGGLLVVSYHRIEDTDRMLREKFPSPFYQIIYPFHWIFFKVCSKIQGLYQLQEVLSRGKNKVFSWVEVSGRLAYAGFDTEAEFKVDGKQWIIARKVKTPSENPNPSYFIFIQLNRVTLFGNIIRINKLRSMYPYSEFLQKKIYEQNSLNNTGKFKDDPRITTQGRVFRKYWLDELPQFIDWLRGDIKLVGIRAMSQHFFSLYNEEYKELYYNVKPGIISPIFDEKTADFEEIQRVEYEYLKSYVQHPLKTDWKYFWITFLHIIRGVRSK